jgi:hypothetical protein
MHKDIQEQINCIQQYKNHSKRRIQKLKKQYRGIELLTKLFEYEKKLAKGE